MPKTIYIKDLSNDKEYELSVEETLKISELKTKIEGLVGRQIESNLLIQKNKRGNPTSVSDQTKTIKEAHIPSGSTVIVGKTLAVGGSAIIS